MAKTIIIEKERRDTDEAIRRALRVAQEAYRALKDMEDIDEVPQPHLCDEAWAAQVWERKKEAIRNADYLTDGQKKAQRMHWAPITKAIHANVQTIQDFLSGLPEGQYVYDATIDNMCICDIDALIVSRCTREVPQEAETHAQLIANVRTAIDELRAWERTHDVKRQRIESLYNLAPHTLEEWWATGAAVYDHRFDHLPNVVLNRRLAEDGIL